jgi:putative aldouronate transport system substrate-binding protein
MTKNSLVSIRQKAETIGKGKYDAMKTIQLPQYNQISDKLEQLTIKNYVDFITGRRPLSEFDKFVDEWKKTGGEQAILEAQKKYDENFKKK